MPKTTPKPVIELKKLSKYYGSGSSVYKVLDDISLKINRAEFVAIMGPSGCGKTTLLNTIGLLDRIDEGEYFLDGKSIDQISGKQRARIRSSQIGIVFQSFNLINRLTVLENVALPLTYKGVRRTKRLIRASEVLRNFHLQEREYYMPWQLSGGQMQRVAIARALVNEPSIILADEPTGNLDSRASHVIMEELSELHAKGNTIIMVTHNPDLTSYASRVIDMLDGRIDKDTGVAKAVRQPKPKTKRLSARTAKATKATSVTKANRKTSKSDKATKADKSTKPTKATKQTKSTKGKAAK